MTTNTATVNPGSTEGSSLRRYSFLTLGVLLAAPALFGLLVVTVRFLRHDIDLSSALQLQALLAIPYSAGLLTFFYAKESYVWPRAVRRTLIVLAVTAAALVLLKFIALALPTLGNSDDRDSDDDGSGSGFSFGEWFAGSSSNYGPTYGRDGRTTMPILPTTHPIAGGSAACPGCGGYGNGYGLCSVCSSLGGSIAPWGI